MTKNSIALGNVPRWHREGYTVVELLATAAILAVVMTVILQLTSVSTRQYQLLRRHRLGLLACGNLMGIAMALPYDELTTDNLLPRAAELLPDRRAAWSIRIDSASADAGDFTGSPAKRIELILDWPLKQGETESVVESSLRLVGWKYPDVMPRPPPSSGKTPPQTEEQPP